MNKLNILHLEDSPAEAKLIKMSLAGAGILCDITRVDTRVEFEQALHACTFDLILADYSLPQFDGRTALETALGHCGEVPFVVVSGAVGEETAVELLKAGATDYVLKRHLDRLAPAVERAIRETQERRDRRRAEQALKDARDAAEAASRAKDHFLAVLSHELRTPLAPILTTAQLMESDALIPTRAREAFAMIRRNVELEARLIDDLLDITRISHGKLELQVGIVDLHEKLQHVLEIIHSDLRGNQLSLLLELHAEHRHIQADPARVQQVLWNLLKNAIKFTPVGGRLSIATSNPEPGKLRVSVSDTGIGIDPEAMGKLFQAFEQGGRDMTRLFGGLGLGLAISRALVDMHHGELTAHSEGRGRGATFIVTLPTTRVAVAQLIPETDPPSDAEQPNQCRILLVEDHADTARAMAMVLNRQGYVVRTADTIAGALRAADAEPFDLIISDLGLPDGSGLDLMRQLTARRPIKGIAVSGYGMEEDMRQSRDAGFCDHIVKPINLRQLDDVVKRAIEGQSSASVRVARS